MVAKLVALWWRGLENGQWRYYEKILDVYICKWWYMRLLLPLSTPRPGEGAHQGERHLAPEVKCSLLVLTICRWLDEGFSLPSADSISARGLHVLLTVIQSPFDTICTVGWNPPTREDCNWSQQVEQLLDRGALIYGPCCSVHTYWCWCGAQGVAYHSNGEVTPLQGNGRQMPKGHSAVLCL